MLSYQADLTIENNPFEMGLDRLVDLDGEVDFIAKDALKAIRMTGIKQRQVGLTFDGAPITGSNDSFWPLRVRDAPVGKVTSAVYSPIVSHGVV